MSFKPENKFLVSSENNIHLLQIAVSFGYHYQVMDMLFRFLIDIYCSMAEVKIYKT